ncbi:MAG: hypothetical protein AB7F88_00090 [Pyrinomonadaceae bacterium]
MEQTTLKYLRILIPGIICLLGIFPAYRHYLGSVFNIGALDTTYLTLICIILGAIYYQLNLRWFLVYPSLKIIDNKILDSLKETYPEPLSTKQVEFLKEDDRFKTILYRLIDNDESLKKKASGVYFNGIFWTSTADLFFFSTLFFGLYRWAFITVPNATVFSWMFFLVAIMSLLLHILSVVTHVRLGKGQFKYVRNQMAKEAKEYTDVVLQQLREPAKVEGPRSNSKDKGRVSKK